MNTGLDQTIQYLHFETRQWKPERAEIVVETPVSLTVNGEIWLTFMCTPVALEAMAVGFLFNEEVIHNRDEVISSRICASGENVDVWLTHNAEKPTQWRRTSGCTGGVTSINIETVTTSQPTDGMRLTPTQISECVSSLFDAQELYRRSGGVHTSILSDGKKILAVAEDIGRHNTLDKLAGLCLMDNIEHSGCILLTTGRVSSEMMQKAHRLGALIVISRTSPSSLSIQMAEGWGITLIGYARRASFRVYTHTQRITTEPTRPEMKTEEDHV
jgi:FdhD protein